MSNLIPFETATVPAVLGKMFGDANADLVGNSASGGFPVISIKGKVFHIQRGDDRTLVTRPGEDAPAPALEVVIIKANPNKSKVYYSGGYIEGEQAKPTCYSNNGVAPESDAQMPQAKSCAACPHNQWGSKITESGAKSKSCSDSRRLAVATPDAPADPMLVRVPAASMKSLEEYGKQLAARGVPPQAVVTKIGFDYSVAYPSLTFKPVALIGDADLLRNIKAAADSELAAQIVGMKPMPSQQRASEAAEAVAPVVQAVAPAPQPVKASKPKAQAADPVEAAVSAAPKTAPVNIKVEDTGNLEQSLQSMLDDLDFDN